MKLNDIKKQKIFIFLLYLVSHLSLAESNNFFLEFGVYKGGDEIPTEEINSQHLSRVNAGELVSVSLGTVFQFGSTFNFAPSLGIKYNSNGFDFFNYDTTRWKIYTLNLPLAYRTDDWQFSLGLTYHHKPTLTLQSKEYSEEWEFDSSIGTIIALDYYYDNDASIGLRYTKIDYTMQGIKPVNGDNFGLIWHIFFSL